MLRLVAEAEQGSEHPLAAAIVEGAKARGLVLGAAPEHVTAIAGRGLEATVEGHAVLIGTRRLLSERSIAYDAVEEQLIALEQQGKTAMIVVIDGKVAGLVAVADTVKVGSAEAIKQLHAQGLAVWMITGDNRRAAAGYCSAGWHPCRTCAGRGFAGRQSQPGQTFTGARSGCGLCGRRYQ